MSRIRVGVIGTGFGRTVQLPGFKGVPGVEVTAVCSAQLQRAQDTAREFGIPRATADYRELIAMDEVDLVSISTPSDSHREMANAAFAAGKHVICEKPMALNIREAREMTATAKASGRVHVIDHEMRYIPARRRLRELVDEGYIGVPQFVLVSVHLNMGVIPTRKPYYYSRHALKEKAGGALNILCSHYIDLTRFWFGDFAQIAGRTKIIVPKRPVLPFELRDGDHLDENTPTLGEKEVETDDSVMFTGTLKNGALVAFTGSWSLHHGQGMRVEAYGNEGTLRLDRDEKLWGARKGEARIGPLEIPERLRYGHPAGGLTEAFAAMVHETVLTIQQELKGKPAYATFEDGMKTQEMVDAIFLSEQGPGWIRLPLP